MAGPSPKSALRGPDPSRSDPSRSAPARPAPGPRMPPLAERLARLPLWVLLIGLSALAMYVPAAHALAVESHRLARAFFYPATLLLVVTLLLGFATAGWRLRDAARADLATLALAYGGLPLLLAVPFREAVPDTTWLNAWFEMVSSFTTTGASLYEAPGRLPPTVHLWRALVGWLGGFFVLVTAAALLAPMNLGGYEVLAGQAAGGPPRGSEAARLRSDRPVRLVRATLALLPAYAAVTGVLWVALLIAGEGALVAACHAMSTLATSGISPVQGLQGSQAGVAGEMLIFAFLVFALSRRTLPGAPRAGAGEGLRRDPELRMGFLCVVIVPSVLFLWHFTGALDDASTGEDTAAALGALWGSAFTVLSFLSTTGFVSADWAEARVWSGLRSPGLILLALALVGGGVATTAGGVKLLRVFALYKHGLREMDRIVHPSSVGGEGAAMRRLRQEGAYLAWLFFMLFAVSIMLVMAALSLAGLGFEAALAFGIAALSTTGPLAGVAIEAPLSYASLGSAPKVVLAVAMVIGRLETLALIALLAPATWRS